jgi:hypothetical protein
VLSPRDEPPSTPRNPNQTDSIFSTSELPQFPQLYKVINPTTVQCLQGLGVCHCVALGGAFNLPVASRPPSSLRHRSTVKVCGMVLKGEPLGCVSSGFPGSPPVSSN